MKIDYKNKELEKYLRHFFKDEYTDFINAQPEPTGIRINSIKNLPDDLFSKLEFWNQHYSKSEFSNHAIYLAIDKLPLSHTLDYYLGNIYYQGISSQLPVELLDVKPGDKVLDIAAAPGSKSCQILSKLAAKGMLISNDSSVKRIQPLNVNLQRSGATNFYIINTWGERLGQIYPEYFDKVLVDAPCTALGTLANSNHVADWWEFEKLNKLAKSQYGLLVSAIKSLKIGGEIVYSTCSIAPEENEQVIDKIINNYPVEVVETPAKFKKYFSSGFTEFNGIKFDENMKQGIRVYPHKDKFEGFFAIKLKKYSVTKFKKNKTEESFKYLHDCDHQNIQPILQHLSEYWGIRNSVWKNFKFNLLKNRIWMVSNIDKIIKNNFICSGILLAEKKLSAWKLFNNSVIYFGDLITKRIVELDDDKLKILFKTGSIAWGKSDTGYYVLARRDKPIASVYVENEKAHLRIPHSFNLVLD